MSTMQPEQAQTYRNVMESLVVEEVEKQYQKLPAKVAGYVNKAEVVAYALNRLPPLYATSERGWQQQRNRARRGMDDQIKTAVRQAIAAVQRDPLRAVTPLKVEEEQESTAALQGLKELLGREELSWRDLVNAVENALIKTARGEITWRKRTSASVHRSEWHDTRYLL
ncbi:MAG: late competence development ComFB family protein [Leptolyngbyaceae cyanobacterium HOT.MB2.61]|jgi:Late competence development protein ComFB.|nr:late competence development ComFB family protein [Leptolyngbyaceae cyanobacterium HOT.MB2.61]